MKLTIELVRAAGQDAGNHSMQKGGRVAWNFKDAQVAVAEFNRLIEKVA